MSGKRPPVIYDGVRIDADWLDEQVATYRPGCVDEAVRMMRGYERADREAAKQQRGAA